MTCGQVGERSLLALDAHPDVGEALGYLGYAGQDIDALMAKRLGEARALCEGFSARGAFVSLPTDALDLPGKDISAHLAGADRLIVMAVTLGMESERALRREMALSATDGLLADAMASSMAEDAACKLHALVSSWALEAGLYAGGRFSPGYGDLPLDVQPLLIERLGAGKLLGLSLTPANLLVPSKSVTAIVGLFPEPRSWGIEVDEAQRKTCENCDRRQICPIYQQGRICHGGKAR